MQADLRAQGIADFGCYRSRGFGRGAVPAALELFFGDKRMPLTRWPKDDWTRIAGIPQDATIPDGHSGTIGKLDEGFFYEGDGPRAWKSFDDIWIHGYWAYDWANSYEAVDQIDPAARFVKTKPPHGHYGFRKGQRIYFLNILEELLQEGQWYLDRQHGILYFWPPAPLDEGAAVVSLLERPLVSLEQVSHVTLRGLTIECGRGHGIKIVGGQSCTVRACTIRNVGNNAVVVEGGWRHTAAGCEIHDSGDGGIMISGGDRKALSPCEHWVHNNHIHRVGAWSRCYCSPIMPSGVGIRVSHNLIHDLPHIGILFGGNDHVIEFNEIHHACMETGDAGAIYAGRDWTMRGNIIRHNYIHHMGGVGMGTMGIYLDDCFSSAYVYGNVFYKVQRAAFIGGGCDNVFENNIFVDCQPAVEADGRGLETTQVWRDNLQTLKERLAEINHRQGPYAQQYPEMAKLDPYLDDPKGVPPIDNAIIRNICSGGQWMHAKWRICEDDLDIRDNLISDEVGFVDRESEDFRLRNDSIAFKLGFQPIPMERIGLIVDEYRSSCLARPGRDR